MNITDLVVLNLSHRVVAVRIIILGKLLLFLYLGELLSFLLIGAHKVWLLDNDAHLYRVLLDDVLYHLDILELTLTLING